MNDRRNRIERFLDRVRIERPSAQTGREMPTVTVPLMRKLEELGLRVTKIHGSVYMERGLPDILARRDGRLVWIETKAGGKTLSPAQREFRRREHAAGVPVMVVRPVDYRRPLDFATHGRITPLDPAEAAYLLITFTHDPVRAVRIVEAEWS